MQAPDTLIAFGLIIVGSAILRPLRARYLDKISEKVTIDFSKEIILRYAAWYYIYPFLGFAGGVILGWDAFTQTNIVRFRVDVVSSLLSFLGALWLLYRQWTARVTIFYGILTYKEGSDRFLIHANEVHGYLSKGFVFWVKLKSEEKFIKIPATFDTAK